ncbi:MAG: hypothetical protein E7355_03560 [Clostridiales bacterium]|nr:hypothetical protein [Clostridiales bacterium]
MARKTREEKREEERRIIAEMESAMPQKSDVEKARTNGVGEEGAQPQKIHCKRCKTLMENGVCPVCGFRIYVPMDERKRKKVRIIVAAACIAVFAALFLIFGLHK